MADAIVEVAGQRHVVDERVLRRLGRGPEQPCANPAVTGCALWRLAEDDRGAALCDPHHSDARVP